MACFMPFLCPASLIPRTVYIMGISFLAVLAIPENSDHVPIKLSMMKAMCGTRLSGTR
jgi:hypothetical protein